VAGHATFLQMSNINNETGASSDRIALVIGAAGFLVLTLSALALWAVFGEEVIRDTAGRAWALCF
jgi:ABC-type glucose/galactose transport system permease subunit